MLPDNSLRSKVYELERHMLSMPSAAHLIELKHYFSPGVYAREIRIPAGMTLTGKIHKYSQLNILSQGKMSVLTENGIQEVEASFTVVSPAGTKRVAYAHTECVWITILHTNENDPELIEKLFTLENENDWLEFNNSKQLELL